MTRFNVQEILDVEVVVEMFDGERLSGIFVETPTPNFICLRSTDGVPYLLNERYIKMIHLLPESEEDNDDTE